MGLVAVSILVSAFKVWGGERQKERQTDLQFYSLSFLYQIFHFMFPSSLNTNNTTSTTHHSLIFGGLSVTIYCGVHRVPSLQMNHS